MYMSIFVKKKNTEYGESQMSPEQKRQQQRYAKVKMMSTMLASVL